MVCYALASEKDTGAWLMEFKTLIQNMYQPLLAFITNIAKTVSIYTGIALVLFLLYFFLRYRINPFTKNYEKWADIKIKPKIYSLMRYILYDIRNRKNDTFSEYGFTLFCGMQGAGKTVSLVEYLEQMKKKYPKCIIVTNFQYSNADHRMKDWQDFFKIRNGTDGVIFAIDEIHSEYSSSTWKDFPESLLSEISQQRKQRIKIVATSQVFSRVVKQLREQCFSVITCKTYFKRYTVNREYQADAYSSVVDNALTIKNKLRPMWKHSFVQSNALRSCYDTYEKIERLEKTAFIPRNERGSER